MKYSVLVTALPSGDVRAFTFLPGQGLRTRGHEARKLPMSANHRTAQWRRLHLDVACTECTDAGDHLPQRNALGQRDGQRIKLHAEKCAHERALRIRLQAHRRNQLLQRCGEELHPRGCHQHQRRSDEPGREGRRLRRTRGVGQGSRRFQHHLHCHQRQADHQRDPRRHCHQLTPSATWRRATRGK